MKFHNSCLRSNCRGGDRTRASECTDSEGEAGNEGPGGTRPGSSREEVAAVAADEERSVAAGKATSRREGEDEGWGCRVGGLYTWKTGECGLGVWDGVNSVCGAVGFAGEAPGKDSVPLGRGGVGKAAAAGEGDCEAKMEGDPLDLVAPGDGAAVGDSLATDGFTCALVGGAPVKEPAPPASSLFPKGA